MVSIVVTAYKSRQIEHALDELLTQTWTCTGIEIGASEIGKYYETLLIGKLRH